MTQARHFDIAAPSFSPTLLAREALDGLREGLPPKTGLRADGTGLQGIPRKLTDICLFDSIDELTETLRPWRTGRMVDAQA